jgi:hypothetical protein
MNFAGVAVLSIVLLLPVAWLVAEIYGSRWQRVSLGILAILSSFAVAWLVGSLQMFSANAWFGNATKELVNTTVSELERGRTDQVLASLKELQNHYRPTYDTRSRYDELVDQAVKQMKSPAPATRSSP